MKLRVGKFSPSPCDRTLLKSYRAGPGPEVIPSVHIDPGSVLSRSLRRERQHCGCPRDPSSDKDEQFMQLLCSMEQESAFRMLEKLREFERRNCRSRKAFLSPRTGCDNKRKNLVRDMKEKERMRRALLSCAAWLISFEFWTEHGVLVERGVPFLHSCRLVVLVVMRGCSMR